MYKTPKLILVCLFYFALISCNNDDNSNTELHPIVGEWLRSDYTEVPLEEFKLFFYNNNEGSTSYLTTTNEGVIGTATSFEWNIEGGTITMLDQDNNTVITTFEITDEGNLLLPDYSPLEFIRQ